MNNNNTIYKKLLKLINDESDAFKTIVNLDDLSEEEILSYLEFVNTPKELGPIVGNILITEGNPLSIIKIINDLSNLEGEYTLFINSTNLGTNTYLVDKANSIYKELNLNLNINIDYSQNYNHLIGNLVNIIGSEDFTSTVHLDFLNGNIIIV